MKLDSVIQKNETPEFEPLTETLLRDLDERRNLASLVPTGQRLRRSDYLMERIDALEERLETARAAEFNRNEGNLPDAILQTIMITESQLGSKIDLFVDDHLTAAARKHKTHLDELRRIADKLGFVIAPYDFVRDEAIALADEKDGTNKAREFEREMVGAFDVFVLGPLSIYDINKHVNTKDSDKIVYWDLSNPVLGAVEMVMPALQGLSARVDKLDERVRQMGSQLERLEIQIAEERRRASELEVAARAFMRRDPLIFAVPRGTDIRDGRTFAILGPCWGEDFDDIVLEALGLR